MAVTLTGSGGLFTRLGAIFKIVERVEDHIDDLDSRIDTADGQYASASRDMVLPLVGARDAIKAMAGSVVDSAWAAAERTIVDMVQADAPQPTRDIGTALRELVSQMTTAGASVSQNASSVSVAAVSGGTGTGKLACHIRDGANIRAEVATAKCVSDGQFSGSSADVSFSYSSPEQAAARPSSDWPTGTQQRKRIPVLDASQDAVGGWGQRLTNADFESWTTNMPDGWFAVTGTAGTHWAQSASIYLRGSSAFQFIGDNLTLAKVEQRLSGSEALKLRPNTTYMLGFWYKDGSSHPSAGVVRVSVRDYAYTVLTGASIQLNASSASSSWQFTSAIFRTGDLVPTAPRMVLELTTAINTGGRFVIDDVFLVQAFPLQREPALYGLVVPGATDFVVDDAFTVTTTNDLANGFQRHFDRAFDLYSRSIVLPSAGSPTISDSLIA